MPRIHFRLPRLLVFSREGAEAYVPSTALEYAISITSPPGGHAILNPRFARVLQLKFCDTTNGFTQPDGYPTITREDAAELVTFVESIRETASTIVIHCEAGVSRSPSVAAALAIIYDRRPHPHDLVNFAVIARLTRAARSLHFGVYGRPLKRRQQDTGGRRSPSQKRKADA